MSDFVETERRSLPRTGYPRRRALAACLTCRERKRKCDNLRPVCSACQQIGTPCEYTKQDASSFDAASLDIIGRLTVIEGLIRGIHPTSSSDPLPPARSSHVARPATIQLHQGEPMSHTVDTDELAMHLDSNSEIATDKILQWPLFQRLLALVHRFQFVDLHGREAQTCLDDLLSQAGPLVPGSNPLMDMTSAALIPVGISTERADIQQLVDQFFERVNCKNPILSQQVANHCCESYYKHGPLFDLETCLVLLTCALGAISVEFDAADQAQDLTDSTHSPRRLFNLRLAHCYFAAAENRLGATMSSINTIAVQCLCLAGLDTAEKESGTYSSLFWTCYKSEREILAEIPILSPALREPSSPFSYPPPPEAIRPASDKWAWHEEGSWYFFLSEIALRRITNQVAGVVSKFIDEYSATSANVGELIPVVAEFERQAETFRKHLPPAIEFPDVPQSASTEWQQFTRGRYYRVLELMHRPFLFAALHDPNCGLPIRGLAERALMYALKYLQHCHPCHRHHGTWLQLRNMLKAASLLLAAVRSPWLTMPQGWESGIDKALVTFEYWSWEFPPCKTYRKVILTLADAERT